MAFTNRYLESEILSADPVKLVSLLYRAAIESASAARRHLAAGEIRERSRKIVKTWEIVNELRRSLDEERGGEISRSLGDLYSYMQNRLLEANAQQKDAPLAEVERLLITLQEGWSAARASASATAPVEEYEPVSCTY